MAADRFRAIMLGQEKTVEEQVDTAAARRIEENRAALRIINSSIIFCGRQGISLRDHLDFGPVLEKPTENDGNFRALLRLRVQAGDDVLWKHKNQLETRRIFRLASKMK